MKSPLRTIGLPLVAGVVAAIVGVPQFQRLADDRSLLKAYDFVQYYSAGSLLLERNDPYDPDLLWPIQRSIYDGVDKTIMMWNPPWALPLTLPFAALPWRIAQFLWIGLQLAAVLISADLLWRMFGGDPHYRWAAWLIALTFAPTLFLLMMGQIPGLILLGLCGFYHYLNRDQPIVAGCFAALTAIKPHLLPLFALVFLLEAIRCRKTRVALISGVVCLAVFSLLPLIWNQHVWSDYLEAMSRPPSEKFQTMREFEHPTLGYWLRGLVPGNPFVVQFVPAILAMVGVVVLWLRSREPGDLFRLLPLLVLVSVLTAGYGAWTFDLVLLLVAVIPIAIGIAKQSTRTPWLILHAAAYLMLNFLVLRTIQEPGSQSNLWVAPAVFIVFLIYGRAVSHSEQAIR